MRFGILGPVEVADVEGRALALGGRKQRAVLAILLLHANEVVASDRLVEELWPGEPPENAAKRLQMQVSRLRHALGERGGDGGEERIVTAAGGYLVRVAPGELDRDRFERLLEEGRAAAASEAWELVATKLRDALGLWRGGPLSDFEYDSFAQGEIARLGELHVGAVEQLIDAELALGREAAVIGALERLVREHPYRERLRGQLMLALYRAGRQAEALGAYRDARAVLVEELGIEPSAELRELHEAILAQDRSLLASAPPRTTLASGEGSFVGYQAELGRLKAALERALSGAGGVVLIGGEPGIGKTRLAEQLSLIAGARGAKVLWGRCWEAGGAPAYWPWLQALRTYLRDYPANQLRARVGPGAVELAQVLPELREVLPGVPDIELAGSEGGRFRLFEAIAGFVRRSALAEPLVFILDDLHAADETSRLLVQFLAGALADSRVLVIGTYRVTELTDEHPLLATIAELDRSACTRIALRGFAPAETARLVELSGGAERLPLLASAIHSTSEGNPLFVTELVRLLDAEGRLTELAAGEALVIPDGVGEVLERRLGRFSRSCRQLLALAAVLGREFNIELVAQASGTLGETLVEDLEQAVAARLVADVPGARGRLRFSHDLVREALYRKLSSARRVRLHKAAGDALECIYAANIEPHLAELAHHYLEAAPGGEAPKAIHYAHRAAQRAAELLAYEEAARLYHSALQTLQSSAAGRERERGELLMELADQLALAGDVSRARPALATAEREAERLGDALLGARAALTRAEVDLIDGTDIGEEGTRRVHAALSVFQERGDTLGEARAWWAVSMRHHPVGRYVAAQEAAERMLECARRAGSQALESKALQRIACSLAHGPTPVAQAIPRLGCILERTDSAYVRSKVLLYLAELEGMRGRYAEARRLADESTALMRELGDARELRSGRHCAAPRSSSGPGTTSHQSASRAPAARCSSGSEPAGTSPAC